MKIWRNRDDDDDEWQTSRLTGVCVQRNGFRHTTCGECQKILADNIGKSQVCKDLCIQKSRFRHTAIWVWQNIRSDGICKPYVCKWVCIQKDGVRHTACSVWQYFLSDAWNIRRQSNVSHIAVRLTRPLIALQPHWEICSYHWDILNRMLQKIAEIQ